MKSEIFDKGAVLKEGVWNDKNLSDESFNPVNYCNLMDQLMSFICPQIKGSVLSNNENKSDKHDILMLDGV